MSALFRLPTAMPDDPAVNAWFGDGEDPLRRLVQPWFARMRACGADVRELMHDGGPTACVQDAAFAYVAAFRAHANIGFFHGTELDDPAHLLEGSGKRMRHVKLRPGASVDTAALETLILAAYRDIRTRLAAGR